MARLTRPLASLMGRASRSSQMARSMKVISRRDRHTVSAEESLPRAKSSKVYLAMIRWTAMVTFSGKMDLFMRVYGLEERSQARENSTGLMDRYMRASSKTTSVMAQEFCTIHAGRNSKDSGKQAKRTVDVSTHGPTEQSTTLSTSTARSKERVSWKTLLCLSKSSRIHIPQTLRNRLLRENL